MVGWTDTPAPSTDWDGGDTSFQPTNSFEGTFNTQGGGAGGAGFGDFGAEPSGGDGCRNCGEEGHFARECPQPRKMTGECFNCGQTGHNKADCTNEKVARPFTGECRICHVQGHPAAECPDAGPVTCKNCLGEGHRISECKENRFISYVGVPDVDTETAWAMMKKADSERDIDDFKAALQMYTKADRAATYDELETRLTKEGFSIHLVALEKEMPKTLTVVNLQGKSGCQYVVGYYFGITPRRQRFGEGFPKSAEENIERLKDAGEAMEQLQPVCLNCNEVGHISKKCPQEKTENVERVQVMCSNCNEVGHRFRDCKQPREDRNVCRNCKQSGHKASDCTEPRSAEGVECKRCNEMGHFAKDCPNNEGGGNRACRNCGQEGHMAKECDQPKNPANTTCRNCDEVGHFSKDCPKPRDYSRIKCSVCGEMGHTKVRCPNPGAGEFGDSSGANGADGFNNNDSGFGNEAPAGIPAANASWNTGATETGGW